MLVPDRLSSIRTTRLGVNRDERHSGTTRDRDRHDHRRRGDRGPRRRTIGYGPFSFVPFLPGLVDPAALFVRSSEFPRGNALLVKLAGLVTGLVRSGTPEGYAVLNVASRLTISESMVRTHLRRVYIKCGVHNRAELACALMHSGESRPDRESSGNS